MYGATPPVTDTAAEPLLLPKQLLLIVLFAVTISGKGCVTTVLARVEQPLKSVTVTMYNPAVKLLARLVFCVGCVFQMKLYGAVPPAGAAVAVPLLNPKPVAAVALAVADRAAAG